MKDEEPKENSIEDVYEEFNNYAGRNGIKEFRSCKTSKYYAFDREGTPKHAEYLEVRYAATYPQMDSTYSGRSIEAVFGSSVNALELLLIERNIKGPCWLDVKCPTAADNPVTWSKLQVIKQTFFTYLFLIYENKIKNHFLLGQLYQNGAHFRIS